MILLGLQGLEKQLPFANLCYCLDNSPIIASACQLGAGRLMGLIGVGFAPIAIVFFNRDGQQLIDEPVT